MPTSQLFIDCSKAKFFTLYRVGARPAISVHKSKQAAERKGARLARETNEHFAVGYEDSNTAVTFLRP